MAVRHSARKQFAAGKSSGVSMTHPVPATHPAGSPGRAIVCFANADERCSPLRAGANGKQADEQCSPLRDGCVIVTCHLSLVTRDPDQEAQDVVLVHGVAIFRGGAWAAGAGADALLKGLDRDVGSGALFVRAVAHVEQRLV